MDTLVDYRLEDSVAWISMDDGKANVMSPTMMRAIHRALDQAGKDRAVVVLRGRPGVFSGGFDLSILRSGSNEAISMVRGGFELSERVLSFPTPVVMACTGHAVAMGVFLLLSGDYRIGVSGAFRLLANEVAIGLVMPRPAVEVLRQRLTPACFQRALNLSEQFSPANAVEAGFLDRVVDATELDETARATAASLAALNMDAHAESKRRAREQSIAAIRAGIEADFGGFPGI